MQTKRQTHKYRRTDRDREVWNRRQTNRNRERDKQKHGGVQTDRPTVEWTA